MSTNISALYDLFEDRIQAVLPNHLKLSDPYRLEKNTDAEKRKGWGLKTLAGNNPEVVLSCQRLFDQRISVVLSRLNTSSQSEASTKGVVEKALLEDLFSLIKSVEGDPYLGDSSICTDGRWLSHSGVQYLNVDRADYVMIEADFLFRYVENVESV